MLKLEDKNYTLKYNLDRIRRIETALGQSFVAVVRSSGGFLSIEHLIVTVALGLEDADGKGVEFELAYGMVEKAIVEQGYNTVLSEMEQAVERDCPFFFPQGS